MNDNRILYEVIPIRLFLVVLLVFYHAFAIFSDAWAPIENYPIIPFYSFLDKLSYSFLLETFVFVSGYVLGYQVKNKGEQRTFNARYIFVRKFKRLIVPSLLFSTIYLIVFNMYHEPLLTLAYQIACGVGHMWFLPMLYFCFVFIYFIESINIPHGVKLLVVLLMPFASFLPLPFRIGLTLYYFPFFYFGYKLMRTNTSFKFSFVQLFPIIIILFTLSFALKRIVENQYYMLERGGELVTKFLNFEVRMVLRFICASLGVALIWLVSLKLKSVTNASISDRILKVSDCCFGVYIFQQFVLMLFNGSNFPHLVSPYLYPWLVFLLTLILSVLLTLVVRSTSLGRKLM